MWLYIPNVGKPIRITSLQTVVGGVFNNSDIMRVDFSAEYDVFDVEEDRDAFVLGLEARDGPGGTILILPARRAQDEGAAGEEALPRPVFSVRSSCPSR